MLKSKKGIFMIVRVLNFVFVIVLLSTSGVMAHQTPLVEPRIHYNYPRLSTYKPIELEEKGGPPNTFPTGYPRDPRILQLAVSDDFIPSDIKPKPKSIYDKLSLLTPEEKDELRALIQKGNNKPSKIQTCETLDNAISQLGSDSETKDLAKAIKGVAELGTTCY
jgi:hypothetical protein